MEQKESVLPERGALRRVVLRLLVPRSILGLPSELREATRVTNRALPPGFPYDTGTEAV